MEETTKGVLYGYRYPEGDHAGRAARGRHP